MAYMVGLAKIFTPFSSSLFRGIDLSVFARHLADSYLVVVKVERHMPRTRTQFRAPLSVSRDSSPPGLSDGFSPTRKCHAAHDTTLVRRWMNGVEPGWVGFRSLATIVVRLSSLFGEHQITPLLVWSACFSIFCPWL